MHVNDYQQKNLLTALFIRTFRQLKSIIQDIKSPLFNIFLYSLSIEDLLTKSFSHEKSILFYRYASVQ